MTKYRVSAAIIALSATTLLGLCMLTSPLEHLQPQGREQSASGTKYEVAVSYHCYSFAKTPKLQDNLEELSHASAICMLGIRRKQLGGQSLAFPECDNFWHIGPCYSHAKEAHSGFCSPFQQISQEGEPLQHGIPYKGSIVGRAPAVINKGSNLTLCTSAAICPHGIEGTRGHQRVSDDLGEEVALGFSKVACASAAP